jgi:sugar phosphate isomerase/epimerase
VTKTVFSELILLGNPVLQNVKRLMECGSTNIELMCDGIGWNNVDCLWDYLAVELPKNGATFSIHPAAWNTNLASPVKDVRDMTLKLHKDTILFAKKIGAKQVVLHPGFCYSPAFEKTQAKIWAHEATAELIDFSKPLDIRLAFENVGYHGKSIYTFDEFCTVIDEFDDTVGYLIDTGHANINGWDIAALIDRAKERLYGIHIHDNMANADSHLPMFAGNIEWEKVFKEMRGIKRECDFILEYAPGIPLERLAKDVKILNEKLT